MAVTINEVREAEAGFRKALEKANQSAKKSGDYPPQTAEEITKYAQKSDIELGRNLVRALCLPIPDGKKQISFSSRVECKLEDDGSFYSGRGYYMLGLAGSLSNWGGSIGLGKLVEDHLEVRKRIIQDHIQWCDHQLAVIDAFIMTMAMTHSQLSKKDLNQRRKKRIEFLQREKLSLQEKLNGLQIFPVEVYTEEQLKEIGSNLRYFIQERWQSYSWGVGGRHHFKIWRNKNNTFFAQAGMLGKTFTNKSILSLMKEMVKKVSPEDIR